MQTSELLISAVGQVAFALVIGLIVYVVNRKKAPQSFLHYIGLRFSISQLDRNFILLFVLIIFYGIFTTWIQFQFSIELRKMLTNDSSPYWRILKNGFTTSTVVAGFIYCFIQAAAAEEILFRGVIARRLIDKLGFFRGNLIQSIIFWIMHLLIFKLVTGEWFSVLQIYAFISSFGLGLILGYVNYRKNGDSILPSWLLHGFANFSVFLTLAYLSKTY